MGPPDNGRSAVGAYCPIKGVGAALGSPLGKRGLRPFQPRGRSLKDRRHPYSFSVNGFGIAPIIARPEEKVKDLSDM